MSFTLTLVCEDERGQVTDPQELVTAIRDYGMSWPWHNERLDTIRCVTTGTRNDTQVPAEPAGELPANGVTHAL